MGLDTGHRYRVKELSGRDATQLAVMLKNDQLPRSHFPCMAERPCLNILKLAPTAGPGRLPKIRWFYEPVVPRYVCQPSLRKRGGSPPSGTFQAGAAPVWAVFSKKVLKMGHKTGWVSRCTKRWRPHNGLPVWQWHGRQAANRGWAAFGLRRQTPPRYRRCSRACGIGRNVGIEGVKELYGRGYYHRHIPNSPSPGQSDNPNICCVRKII